MNSDSKPFIVWLGEIVDKAIVNLALEEDINVLDIHKAIFLYLSLLSARKNYDSKKIMKILDFMPYKSGLFSEFIEGALEELRGYQDIYVIGKGERAKIRSSPKVTSMPEYKLDEDEQKVLKDLMPLTQWKWETKSLSNIEKMVTEGDKA